MAQGASQDGYVQVATDGAGKKIDNAELTRDDGTVVERQRVVLSADNNPRQQVGVGGELGRGYILTDTTSIEAMCEKLDELIILLKMIHGL